MRQEDGCGCCGNPMRFSAGLTGVETWSDKLKHKMPMSSRTYIRIIVAFLAFVGGPLLIPSVGHAQASDLDQSLRHSLVQVRVDALVAARDLQGLPELTIDTIRGLAESDPSERVRVEATKTLAVLFPIEFIGTSLNDLESSSAERRTSALGVLRAIGLPAVKPALSWISERAVTEGCGVDSSCSIEFAALFDVLASALAASDHPGDSSPFSDLSSFDLQGTLAIMNAKQLRPVNWTLRDELQSGLNVLSSVVQTDPVFGVNSVISLIEGCEWNRCGDFYIGTLLEVAWPPEDVARLLYGFDAHEYASYKRGLGERLAAALRRLRHLNFEPSTAWASAVTHVSGGLPSVEAAATLLAGWSGRRNWYPGVLPINDIDWLHGIADSLLARNSALLEPDVLVQYLEYHASDLGYQESVFVLTNLLEVYPEHAVRALERLRWYAPLEEAFEAAAPAFTDFIARYFSAHEFGSPNMTLLTPISEVALMYPAAGTCEAMQALDRQGFTDREYRTTASHLASRPCAPSDVRRRFPTTDPNVIVDSVLEFLGVTRGPCPERVGDDRNAVCAVAVQPAPFSADEVVGFLSTDHAFYLSTEHAVFGLRARAGRTNEHDLHWVDGSNGLWKMELQVSDKRGAGSPASRELVLKIF